MISFPCFICTLDADKVCEICKCSHCSNCGGYDLKLEGEPWKCLTCQGKPDLVRYRKNFVQLMHSNQIYLK